MKGVIKITELTTIPALKSMFASPGVQKRFSDMLGKKSAGFISSVMAITTGSSQLQACDQKTILSAAGVAAALDLPINQNLGFAALVPYKTRVDGQYVDVCQFQMMCKGYVQLAMRSGQYQSLNCSEVYEGELKHRNRITGDVEFDFDGKTSDTIIGFCAYLKLTNGFEKYFYMTYEEIYNHAKTYSQTFRSPKEFVRNKSKWTTDFKAMALKTVLKLLISKWGIMSIDMQTAVRADQAVIVEKPNGEHEFDYPDNEAIDIDVESVQVESETEAEFQEYLRQEEARAGTKT